ncbi:MAG: hypothetical protein ACRD0V_14335, partial [Acidimicrobiales bacterium]
VAGLLTAPLSDETRRLDAQRARAVGSDPDTVPDVRAQEAARTRSRGPSSPAPKASRAGSTAALAPRDVTRPRTRPGG